MVQAHDRPQSVQKFQFQHYRLVLKEVGRPVRSFRKVRELIQVFRDTLQGTFNSHPDFISLLS